MIPYNFKKLKSYICLISELVNLNIQRKDKCWKGKGGKDGYQLKVKHKSTNV